MAKIADRGKMIQDKMLKCRTILLNQGQLVGKSEDVAVYKAICINQRVY